MTLFRLWGYLFVWIAPNEAINCPIRASFTKFLSWLKYVEFKLCSLLKQSESFLYSMGKCQRSNPHTSYNIKSTPSKSSKTTYFPLVMVSLDFMLIYYARLRLFITFIDFHDIKMSCLKHNKMHCPCNGFLIGTWSWHSIRIFERGWKTWSIACYWYIILWTLKEIPITWSLN